MAYWISGLEVEGHEELQILRQRLSSEQRLWSVEEAEVAEIRVGPSSFVKIKVWIMSGCTSVIDVLPPSSAVVVVVVEHDDMREFSSSAVVVVVVKQDDIREFSPYFTVGVTVVEQNDMREFSPSSAVMVKQDGMREFSPSSTVVVVVVEQDDMRKGSKLNENEQ